MILEKSDRCPASQHRLATVNGVERSPWLRLRPRYLGPARYHTMHGEESVASAPPSLPRPSLVPCTFGEDYVALGSALVT